jgi:hypothetical protein
MWTSVSSLTLTGISEVFRKVTILVTLSALPCPDLVPNLKLIHVFSAGVDHIGHTSIYKNTDIRTQLHQEFMGL